MLRKYGGVHGVAVEITERIKRKKLDLAPIRYFERLDGLSGKTRLLGMESPMEQCMDYVAVCALMPLFEAKIGPFQCASIPGRGQIYGKCALEKWVRRLGALTEVHKGRYLPLLQQHYGGCGVQISI